MSDDLYPTMLRWSGGRGAARHDDVAMRLREVPHIDGFDGLTEIDYRHGIVAEWRPGSDRMQEMTPEQCAEVLRMLIRMAQDARDAIDGQSTLAVVIHSQKVIDTATGHQSGVVHRSEEPPDLEPDR